MATTAASTGFRGAASLQKGRATVDRYLLTVGLTAGAKREKSSSGSIKRCLAVGCRGLKNSSIGGHQRDTFAQTPINPTRTLLLISCR
jgi:hypothetical protein